jgi:hypothetical protein
VLQIEKPIRSSNPDDNKTPIPIYFLDLMAANITPGNRYRKPAITKQVPNMMGKSLIELPADPIIANNKGIAKQTSKVLRICLFI